MWLWLRRPIQNSWEVNYVAEAEDEAQKYGSGYLRERQGPGAGQEPFLPQSLVQKYGFHLHVRSQDHTHMEQLVTVTYGKYTKGHQDQQ